jgi:hypothetical protein
MLAEITRRTRMKIDSATCPSSSAPVHGRAGCVLAATSTRGSLRSDEAIG